MFGLLLKYLSRLVLKLSIVLHLITSAGREFHTFTILLKKKKSVLLFRSEALTNDFKTIPSGTFLQGDNKIIVHIDVVNAMELFENLSDLRAVFVFPR